MQINVTTQVAKLTKFALRFAKSNMDESAEETLFELTGLLPDQSEQLLDRLESHIAPSVHVSTTDLNVVAFCLRQVSSNLDDIKSANVRGVQFKHLEQSIAYFEQAAKETPPPFVELPQSFH